MTVWTEFWDMHGLGYKKLEYNKIYIQAKEEKAIKVFNSRFNVNPEKVTCNCCGQDYAITEVSNLEVQDIITRSEKHDRIEQIHLIPKESIKKNELLEVD